MFGWARWIGRVPLQYRHNERDGVSNNRCLDCSLDLLFRRRSKKTSKLRVTALCEGNSPVTGEFPAQRTSNAENISIWWRNHGQRVLPCLSQLSLSVSECCWKRALTIGTNCWSHFYSWMIPLPPLICYFVISSSDMKQCYAIKNSYILAKFWNKKTDINLVKLLPCFCLPAPLNEFKVPYWLVALVRLSVCPAIVGIVFAA